jgi:ParB family transcriptional regulator, chromosome partitioning protein
MTTTVLPTAPDDLPEGLDDCFVGLPSSSTAPKLPKLRFEYVDPRVLIDNPSNLRTTVGDVEDIKASMAEVGILCPLVLVPVALDGTGTGLMIEIGHRRKRAAIELDFPLVPCIIAPDEGAAMLIVAQLAENGHREGLSATEEAEGFHQLTLLDWTAEKIAKVRHIPAAAVKQSLKLRTLPEAARDAADAGTLTLDDAAVMAEFSDQPAVMSRILKSANSGWGFRHAVATERSKQAYANAKERVKAELVLAGVKITSKPKGWGYTNPGTEAGRLVDADGVRLAAEQVRTRPGFAAFIDKIGDGAQAVVYCTDPDDWGYRKLSVVNRSPTPGLSPEEQAAREQAEQAKAAHQQALKVARSVRTDFYRQTYTATRMIKRLFPGALRAAVATGGGFYYSDVDGLYARLGGVDGEALTAAKEHLLSRCLAAQWICRQERNLRNADEGWHGHLDEDEAVAWLDQLVTDGYTLSDAETQLRHDLANAIAEQDKQDAEPGQSAEPSDQDEPADAVADLAASDDDTAAVDGPTEPADEVAVLDRDCGASGDEGLAAVTVLPGAATDDESAPLAA